MRNLFIDFETLSECDIKKSGADAYARHPSTAIICMAYSIDGGRPSIYIPPEELKRSMLDPSEFPYNLVTALPYVVIEHVQTGGTVTAHNVAFDYNIWNRCAPKDWPRLHPENVECTMAKACAMALPASLGMLGEALNVPLKKNPSGSRLIKKMCTPPFESSPQLMAEMLEYCARDVETMAQINKRLKPLSDDERRVWLVNFKANQRGLRLDQDLICEAIRLAGEADVELGQQAESVAGLSLGALRSPKQVLEWLETQGVDLPSLDKATMATFETDNALVQQVLELREEVCKSSIKKFLTMEGNTCPDGRARGNHVYHKATTGRFAGSGIQIQNLPRPALDDPDSVADHLAAHGTLPDGLGVSTKTALSSLLRSCIIPAEGKEFFCADFSSIESRVLFWLAGDKKGLDVYKQGDDLYCVTASGIFGYPVNKKEHPRERSIGKVAVLSCIAEGQEVLTDHGLVPIEKVTTEMKVWDGVDWVNHGGILHRGIKEVIEYDGLTATEGHIVFTEDGREVPFGACAREQIPLAKTGLGREAVRVGGSSAPLSPACERGENVTSSLCWLQNREEHKHGQLVERENQRVPELQPAEASSKMAREAHELREGKMSKSKRRQFSQLRRARSNVRIQNSHGRRVVGGGKSWSPSGARARQDRQQSGVRGWEYSLGYSSAKLSKYAPFRHPRRLDLQIGGLALCGEHRTAFAARRRNTGGDIEAGRVRCSDEAQRVARYKGSVRVYDILNCGPRNRFTVSGALVHNCGYGGGVKAFTGMCEQMGVDLAGQDPQRVVDGYRDTYQKTRQFWWDCETAAMKAMENAGDVFKAGKHIRFKYRAKDQDLRALLPSGRVIHWPFPELKDELTPWGAIKPQISFGSMGLNHKWTRKRTYAGDLAQSCTQATARDLLTSAMVRIDSAGFPVVLHVHDEIMSEVDPSAGFDKFIELMETAPSWAKGLPIRAEGWRGRRYQK